MKGAYSAIYTVGISLVVVLILTLCLEILPNSPFQSYLHYADEGTFYSYVQYVFYFLPIDKMIATLQAWSMVMIQWYIFRFCYVTTTKVSGGATNLINGVMKGGK